MSVDDVNYIDELAGYHGFVFVRCTTQPSGAGAWYRGLATAAILDELYFLEEHALPALDLTVTEVAQVANEFAPWGEWASNYEGSVDANEAAVYSTLASLLQDPTHQESENGPQGDAVALCFNSQQIVHGYHTAPTSLHGWRKDGDTGAFNLDALRQTAIWTAVAGSVTVSQDEFFNDTNAEYAVICKYPVQIGISLMGVRGPLVVPESVTAPPVPPLPGYPVGAPKLTRSGPALVTYAGTNVLTAAFTPPGGLFTPIFPVQAGGTVQVPFSGYAPGMQVAVFSMSASPSQRFDLNVLWCGFGKIALTMANGAAPGIFEVRYCRYQVPGPGGWVWGPWRQILADQRAHLLVIP